MKKSLAIAIAAVFVIVAMPTSQAETVTAHYDVPSGASNATCGNPACAIAWSVGDPSWDEDWWCLEDEDACEQTIDPVTSAAFGTARDVALGDDGFTVGIFSLDSVCGDCYTDFQVSIQDTLPAQTLFNFCIITEHQDGREDPDGDNFCGPVDPRDPNLQPDDIEDPRVEACGSGSVTSPVPSGGQVNSGAAFVFATHVDATTGNVCLGSSGTFTVEMS